MFVSLLISSNAFIVFIVSLSSHIIGLCLCAAGVHSQSTDHTSGTINHPH